MGKRSGNQWISKYFTTAKESTKMNLDGEVTSRTVTTHLKAGGLAVTIKSILTEYHFKGESLNLKRLLEMYDLTKLRQFCAQEALDLLTFGYCGADSDQSLILNFDIDEEELPTLRQAINTAKAMTLNRQWDAL
jgi:hypothetical protein